MWYLKKIIQMNLLTKQKSTHRHRKQTNSYQRGRWQKGINQELGISRYTLLTEIFVSFYFMPLMGFHLPPSQNVVLKMRVMGGMMFPF